MPSFFLSFRIFLSLLSFSLWQRLIPPNSLLSILLFYYREIIVLPSFFFSSFSLLFLFSPSFVSFSLFLLFSSSPPFVFMDTRREFFLSSDSSLFTLTLILFLTLWLVCLHPQTNGSHSNLILVTSNPFKFCSFHLLQSQRKREESREKKWREAEIEMSEKERERERGRKSLGPESYWRLSFLDKMSVSLNWN